MRLDIIFKMSIKSSRLCTVGSGLLEAFATAFNIHESTARNFLFPRAHARKHQIDDRSLPCMGPHVPVDVPWLSA